MAGVVRAAPLFSKLVDRLAPVSHELASALKAAGVEAVGRYVETLTAYERDGLFDAGLGILLLSKAPLSPLTAAFGTSRAGDLVGHATRLGAPAGAHFMIDLEAQNGNHVDVLAYDNALSGAIKTAGFVPLAYVGAGQSLSGAELYALPSVHLYWRGGSLKIPEPDCGFALWQIPPLEQAVCNAIVDVNVTGADLRGRRPMLWYSS